jgi:hypothetical protein
MPSSVDLICVAPSRVHEFWPYVEQLLKNATEHCGDWSIGKIRSEVFRGDQLLWITWDGQHIRAAATTKLLREENGAVCLAVACGGEEHDWSERFAPIEEYARDEGCVATRIQGRQGWSRIFKDYKTEWVSLVKRLQ